jgi:hypothetical protein
MFARTRELVGELVGGSADRVAFTQNTSTGLALVVNGIDWSVGDNVLVPADECPSNFYPWTHLRRRRVEVREVPMIDGHADLEALAGLVDRPTRVLAISAVQYSSGYRYDLRPLGELCRARDTLLVVGRHAIGRRDDDRYGLRRDRRARRQRPQMDARPVRHWLRRPVRAGHGPGAGWAPRKRPERQRADYSRRSGTRCIFGAYRRPPRPAQDRMRPRGRDPTCSRSCSRSGSAIRAGGASTGYRTTSRPTGSPTSAPSPTRPDRAGANPHLRQLPQPDRVPLHPAYPVRFRQHRLPRLGRRQLGPRPSHQTPQRTPPRPTPGRARTATPGRCLTDGV